MYYDVEYMGEYTSDEPYLVGMLNWGMMYHGKRIDKSYHRELKLDSLLNDDQCDVYYLFTHHKYDKKEIVYEGNFLKRSFNKIKNFILRRNFEYIHISIDFKYSNNILTIDKQLSKGETRSRSIDNNPVKFTHEKFQVSFEEAEDIVSDLIR